MQLATQECRGELEAKEMQCLPQNIQQIKNYCRTGHSKDNAPMQTCGRNIWCLRMWCKSSSWFTVCVVFWLAAQWPCLLPHRSQTIQCLGCRYNVQPGSVLCDTDHIQASDACRQHRRSIQQWLAPSSYIRGKILHLSIITLPIQWFVLKRSSSLWNRWRSNLDWSICPQLPFCQAASLFHPHEKEHLDEAQG